MRIRSITCFIDPGYPLDPGQLETAGKFIKLARQSFEESGYEVQSTRLASGPFARMLPDLTPDALARFAVQLEKAAADQGYAYVSLGPALPGQPESYQCISPAMAVTQNTFFGGSMTTGGGDISLAAVRWCAEVIQRASTLSGDGFANLRFAALASVPAGSPFFPAAYHAGAESYFALATESADLAVKAFSEASSLHQARAALVDSIESQAGKLAAIARQIEKQTPVRFGGIDFSLAPFPSPELSLGAAMEELGVPGLGHFGSLAAAAFLADAIDRAQFFRSGFSGLMLPVLEDANLARAAASGSLQVKDLLLYSAVCGTGLDCVPLPGDTSVDQLYAILLDLASLSTRLAKPLTARLLPIPGKQPGDPTDFDFAYFANSRVMELSSQPLSGLLIGDENYRLHPRSSK